MIGPPSAIGFVGLGQMGLPMAERLARAGYRVRGYDLDPPAAAQVVGVCASAAGAARDAAALVLMLPDSDAVARVLFAQGVLDAVPEGCLIVDMGSSQPARTRALASTIEDAGASLLDAPVSGGVAGARAGSLTVMAGGRAEDLARARALFDHLATEVIHVGSVGAGHAVKALNNLLGAISLLSAVEAITVGVRFGLDPTLILEAVNASTGRSWSTEHKLPTFVVPRHFASGFRLRLLLKDMRIALGLAEEAGASLALGESALSLWEEAAESLPADADHTEIVRWVERHVSI